MTRMRCSCTPRPARRCAGAMASAASSAMASTICARQGGQRAERHHAAGRRESSAGASPDTTGNLDRAVCPGRAALWCFQPDARDCGPSTTASSLQAARGLAVQRSAIGLRRPLLGAMFQMNDAWSVYGNHAAGFRAPNAGQINAFFENLFMFYKSIPNPGSQGGKAIPSS